MSDTMTDAEVLESVAKRFKYLMDQLERFLEPRSDGYDRDLLWRLHNIVMSDRCIQCGFLCRRCADDPR